MTCPFETVQKMVGQAEGWQGPGRIINTSFARSCSSVPEGEHTECLALKLQQGKPVMNGSCQLPFFSVGSSEYKKLFFFFKCFLLHAQFNKPTKVDQKVMEWTVSPIVLVSQANSERSHKKSYILYIIDNENQTQHNSCLINHTAYTQTETLTIIKVAEIAAVFPTRRIINLPGIPFWSCWRFLGWWTRSCIFTGSLLPVTVKRTATKKIIPGPPLHLYFSIISYERHPKEDSHIRIKEITFWCHQINCALIMQTLWESIYKTLT